MLHHLQAILTEGLRQLYRPKDTNGIGFDTYSTYGAYHWKELPHNATDRSQGAAGAALVGSEYACLDLGCGDGVYVYGLSNTWKHLIGRDAGDEALRLANTPRKAHTVPNCRCSPMPRSHVTLKQCKAPRPRALVRVAGRLVKPYGRVRIGTPLFVRAALVAPAHVQHVPCKQCASEMVCDDFRIHQACGLPMVWIDGKTYAEGCDIAVGPSTPQEERGRTRRAAPWACASKVRGPIIRSHVLLAPQGRPIDTFPWSHMPPRT